LIKNNMTVTPTHPPYSSDLAPCGISVSPIEDKLEGRHSDTNEVIEGELQAVLNSLTEHDF
jgi:hypothetical protein